MKNQKRNNAIIYTRVSKPTLDRKRVIEIQKAACEKYAGENGLNILEYFEDADILNREALFAMLEYIRENKERIEFILVTEKGAISTDSDYLSYIVDSLLKDGIRIITVNSGSPDSDSFSIMEEAYQCLYKKEKVSIN